MTVENGLWAYLARNAIFETVTICQKCVLNLSNFILYCLTVASMTPQYSSAQQRKDNLWQKYTSFIMQTVVFYYVFYCSRVDACCMCVHVVLLLSGKRKKSPQIFQNKKMFLFEKVNMHSLKINLCKVPHSPSLFLSVCLPVVCYLC